MFLVFTAFNFQRNNKFYKYLKSANAFEERDCEVEVNMAR